jgi:hypothetical protein
MSPSLNPAPASERAGTQVVKPADYELAQLVMFCAYFAGDVDLAALAEALGTTQMVAATQARQLRRAGEALATYAAMARRQAPAPARVVAVAIPAASEAVPTFDDCAKAYKQATENDPDAARRIKTGELVMVWSPENNPIITTPVSAEALIRAHAFRPSPPNAPV